MISNRKQSKVDLAKEKGDLATPQQKGKGESQMLEKPKTPEKPVIKAYDVQEKVGEGGTEA